MQSELPADPHWMLVCNIFPVQSEKESCQNISGYIILKKNSSLEISSQRLYDTECHSKLLK